MGLPANEMLTEQEAEANYPVLTVDQCWQVTEHDRDGGVYIVDGKSPLQRYYGEFPEAATVAAVSQVEPVKSDMEAVELVAAATLYGFQGSAEIAAQAENLGDLDRFLGEHEDSAVVLGAFDKFLETFQQMRNELLARQTADFRVQLQRLASLGVQPVVMLWSSEGGSQMTKFAAEIRDFYGVEEVDGYHVRPRLLVSGHDGQVGRLDPDWHQRDMCVEADQKPLISSAQQG